MSYNIVQDLFQRTLDATLTLIGKASDQIKRMRSSSTLKTGASTMPSSIVANGVGTEKDLSDAPAPPMNSEGATWVAPKPNGTTGVLDVRTHFYLQGVIT